MQNIPHDVLAFSCKMHRVIELFCPFILYITNVLPRHRGLMPYESPKFTMIVADLTETRHPPWH